jgi:MFS family permease
MALMMILVTRMGDLIGRKWPNNISCMISIPITIGIIFSKNLTLTTVLLFFFGGTCPGREQVAFVYICELVPEKSRSMIGSLMLFADGTTIALLAVYFRYIDKNWEYFQYVSCGINLISVIYLTLAVPESPKYIHSRGEFDRARTLLAHMAKVNRVKGYSSNFKFKEEVGAAQNNKPSMMLV